MQPARRPHKAPRGAVGPAEQPLVSPGAQLLPGSKAGSGQGTGEERTAPSPHPASLAPSQPLPEPPGATAPQQIPAPSFELPPPTPASLSCLPGTRPQHLPRCLLASPVQPSCHGPPYGLQLPPVLRTSKPLPQPSPTCATVTHHCPVPWAPPSGPPKPQCPGVAGAHFGQALGEERGGGGPGVESARELRTVQQGKGRKPRISPRGLQSRVSEQTRSWPLSSANRLSPTPGQDGC